MSEISGYSRAQIALHWGIVLLLGVSYFSSDAMKSAWIGFHAGPRRLRHGGLAAHVWIGSAILFLALSRVAIRLNRGAPALPAGGSKVTDIDREADPSGALRDPPAHTDLGPCGLVRRRQSCRRGARGDVQPSRRAGGSARRRRGLPPVRPEGRADGAYEAAGLSPASGTPDDRHEKGPGIPGPFRVVLSRVGQALMRPIDSSFRIT